MKALQNVFREISGKHGLGAASFVAVAVLFWVICLSCVSAILCCLWRFGWLAMAHDMSDDSDEAETQARRGQ